MSEINKRELFLIEEYKSAGELTFQMDSLRNKLTSFYISFAGIAIAGLLIILKGNEGEISIKNLDDIISLLMILVTIIGYLFICVLAKIRKVQLEHFVIINNIRTYFFKNHHKLWEVIQLSISTLPKARFFSGSYFWQLIIQIVNSFMLGIGVLLKTNVLDSLYSTRVILLFLVIFSDSLVIQHVIYFNMANSYKTKPYSIS